MLTDQLRSTPLFEKLTDSQRERIAERMKEVDVDLGAVLARQGDMAYHLFVVLEGTAAVTIVDGELVTLLRPGNTFGEIGVLDHGRRTANVVAVSPMRLLTMTIEDFTELAEEFPEFAARAKALAQARLARTES
jgi:CRP/FNR family cyclic AMP-dependent transcriptional regulator